MTTGWVYKNKLNHILYPGMVVRAIALGLSLYILPEVGSVDYKLYMNQNLVKKSINLKKSLF